MGYSSHVWIPLCIVITDLVPWLSQFGKHALTQHSVLWWRGFCEQGAFHGLHFTFSSSEHCVGIGCSVHHVKCSVVRCASKHCVSSDSPHFCTDSFIRSSQKRDSASKLYCSIQSHSFINSIIHCILEERQYISTRLLQYTTTHHHPYIDSTTALSYMMCMYTIWTV